MNSTVSFIRNALLAAAALAIVQPGAAFEPPAEPAAPDGEPRISPFSGEAVPRYASLAYGKVNGRAGPGLHYPVRWLYVRSGLPVRIIKESLDWRKIVDPGGEEVWMHKRMLVGRRTAIVTKKGMLLPADGQHRVPIAEVHPGVVGDLIGCDRQWCEIRVGGHSGRVSATSVWGHGSTETSGR